MKTYGLERTFEFEYEGEVHKIKMKSSVGLLGLYKSYFYTDLLSDLVLFLKKINIKDAEKVKQIDVNKEIESYTAEELQTILEIFDENGSVIDTVILTQIMAALILNAVAKEDRPGMPEALDIVPYHFLTDHKVIKEVVDLITPFVTSQKK